MFMSFSQDMIIRLFDLSLFKVDQSQVSISFNFDTLLSETTHRTVDVDESFKTVYILGKMLCKLFHIETQKKYRLLYSLCFNYINNTMYQKHRTLECKVLEF